MSIADVAYEVVARKFTPSDTEPGMCAMVTRQMLMRALGLSYDQFYARFRTVAVDGRSLADVPWARDIQATLRSLGYNVPLDEVQGGDILCTWQLAKQGHIGVLYDSRLLIENTGQSRGLLISGFNRLTPVEQIPVEHWEAFRIPN